MIVCIAEKPTVAKDIAFVLGARERRNGYFEGNNYQVTWTFGHFCTLKEPHDYHPEWKSWRLEYLPMIPHQFGIKLIQNQGVLKQFEVISALLKDCEAVVNCGDAGQEGELIQRWVLLKANCKAPVKRLWISSLTEEAIREGFLNLKEAKHYDNLYAAGSARAIGDWLLGMNATRLFTTKFPQANAVLSIGRVQTPTLAMIVQRQLEVDNFKTTHYWELKTKYKDVIFTAAIDRLQNLERAEKGLAYLKEYLFEITDVEVKEGKEKNPRLFDLTALQVEANKKFAFTADFTLKTIQSLYEKKHVTYPRVDTTYLSEDIHPKISGILHALTGYQAFTQPLLSAPIPMSKAVFDNTKVTDHHAIIPTTIYPSQLGYEEGQLYDLIVKRFIAVFYPECIVSNTTILGKVGSIPFKVTGKQIIVQGWRNIYTEESLEKDENKDEQTNQVLPHFETGESGPHEPYIHQGKTSPPKLYTEATILRAMETAGKQVDDEEMRELMKDSGIGRPSTRANIIETLFHRKYIEKKKRNLYATPTGIALIQTIQNDLLKSAELTGLWEQKIRKIEKGTYELATFKQELIDMVVQLTNEVKYSQQQFVMPQQIISEAAVLSPAKRNKQVIDWSSVACPKCQELSIVKGKAAYGCKHFTTCGFTISFEQYGKKLTEIQLLELIRKKKTKSINGLLIDGVVISKKLHLNALFQVRYLD